MLSRKNRLTSRRDFQRVYRSGWRLTKPPIRLHALFRRRETPPRLAFVVANRVAKRATVRNRWKRILRETSRQHLTGLPSGTDAIIILNDITNLTPKNLRAAVAAVFADPRFKALS